MSSGIFFPVAAIGFSILTIITFFCKRPFKSTETKLYKYLMITNFIGLILELNCTLAAYINKQLPSLSDFILKTYLVYNLIWTLILTVYVMYISIDSSILNKHKKKLKTIIYLTTITSIYFIYKLNCNLIIKDNFRVRYTEGTSVDFTYTICGILIFIIILLIFKNKDNLKNQKYIPIYIFLVAIITGIIIQKNIPGLLIMTYVETLTVAIMYHTIENPDMKLMEEVHNAKIISDNANEEKTMFLYNITNEIRNISKDINNEADNILNETDNKKVNLEIVNDSAREIKNDANKFTTMTNEMLDITSLDTTNIKIYNEKYNIKLLLKEIITKYTIICKNKNLEFRTNIQSDLPEILYGDSLGLKNVLISLLDNSIKYTSKGYIELNVNTIKKQDIIRLLITIEDSGIGIKATELEKIFNKNKEELNKHNLKNNLYTARKIITLMNGTLIPSSTYGKGTIMKIILDQKEEITESKYTKIYDKKKILLFEDNDITYKLISKLLKDENITIDRVTLGSIGLEKIRNKEKYDLILIEEDLKPLDAYNIIKKLKSIKSFNTNVILITKDNNKEYNDEYKNYGFKDIIIKPIDKTNLLNIINKC